MCNTNGGIASGKAFYGFSRHLFPQEIGSRKTWTIVAVNSDGTILDGPEMRIHWPPLKEAKALKRNTISRPIQ